MVSHLKKNREATKTDIDYAENLVFITNRPIQAKSQLHRREQAARGIGVSGYANETELMNFNKAGAIST